MKLLLNFTVAILILSSCSTKKDVLLIQNLDEKKLIEINYEQIVIKQDDILKINVLTDPPELSLVFNENSIMNASLQTYQINGYQVDSNGLINLPLIGYLKAEGLTVFELSKLINQTLSEKEILTNPTVNVKIINSYFTILGEVNSPGRYNFLQNNLNLFQAMGMAGDLTINGDRKNIKILRKSENDLKVTNIDITSSEFIGSNFFQIYPNDIIIVDPNSSRVKNAGIIGNSGNLLSLLSFLLSSIILITS